ncbi:MAG: tRNA epoxyqueuosine(34) reductase QueG [Saprospiraceae bacterium]|nr:tRNA epoxyqueuosine(34) reductase QueG [Saprospiraceae bacterium]
MLARSEWKAAIKAEAHRLGFSFFGVSSAGFLEEDAPRLENWLNENRHGKMAYMANHFDKRLDPRLLVPGAKSVLSLMYNYYTPKKQADSKAPKLSQYAYGKDYHFVVKDKLKALAHFIDQNVGAFNGRVFVDSAPVLERSWAKKAGLGWIGKNTQLINNKAGSFFFLAEIICDLELEADGPIKDYCGTCTACIDACPTDAIVEPYKVDGSKCISYYTIELKEAVIPVNDQDKFENWMFGCDICQDVCPWNRFSTSHQTPEFEPHPDLLAMSASDWEELTEEVFQEFFRKSAVKRTGFKGLKRNINFLKKRR